MADKRMFSKSILSSDAFLNMPLSSQALYFHLCVGADDEGFVNNPKMIQRMIGASDGDAQMLIAKNFIIPFDSGVVAIKHWRIHNYIRADRLKATNYQEERRQLELKENGAYTLCPSTDGQLSVNCPSTDGQVADNCPSSGSIDKIRLDKNRVGEIRPPTQDEVISYCKERHNQVDGKRFYNYYQARGWKFKNGEPVEDWKALLRSWEPEGASDPEAKQKRLDELMIKKAALVAAGASKDELETIELNIQSVKDAMEVASE